MKKNAQTFFLDNQLKNPIKQKIYFEKTAPLTFSIKYFVGKCDPIRSFLVYWKNSYWKTSFFVVWFMPTNPKDFNPLTDNITLSIKELKIWRSFKQGSFILIKCTSSHPEVFLRKGVLKMCSKFTGEHPCRSAISIKLQSNFVLL